MTPQEIRAFRERLGLTLDEMAGALGVHRMCIWRWEQPTKSEHHRTAPPYLRRALLGPSVKQKPQPL